MTPTVTREELVSIYEVSQGYLGYLLREKAARSAGDLLAGKIPLPVRINGEILWYRDEVETSLPKIQLFLAKRAKVH